MKAYVKPNVFVDEFDVNETIAACETIDEYQTVTVPCYKTGSHILFYDKCGTNYNNCEIFKYNGNEYLIWPLHSGDDIPTGGLNDDRTFNEIARAYGDSMVHIGLITPTIKHIVNQS